MMHPHYKCRKLFNFVNNEDQKGSVNLFIHLTRKIEKEVQLDFLNNHVTIQGMTGFIFPLLESIFLLQIPGHYSCTFLLKPQNVGGCLVDIPN